MSEITYLNVPLARMVAGDLFVGSQTGYQNKPLTNKDGSPRTEWYVGLAVPKGPDWEALWAQLYAIGQAHFPGGQYNLGHFSWKIKDGDAADQVSKPGRAGHYILRLTSGYVPTVYGPDNQQIIDPNLIWPGDYFLANIGVQGNGNLEKPGIYLNHGAFRWHARGERIQTGPAPEEMFGPPVGGAVPGAGVAPARVGPAAGPGGAPAGLGAPPAAAPAAAHPLAAAAAANAPAATGAALPGQTPLPGAGVPVGAVLPGAALAAPPAGAPAGAVLGQPPAAAGPVTDQVTPGPGFLNPGQR